MRDSANGEDFTVATVNYTGTNLADISAVRLYRESGGSAGTFSSSSDLLLASNTTIGGNPVVLDFSSNPYRLQRNADRQFYIAVDISNNATDGNRVDCRIDVDQLTVEGRTWPDAPTTPQATRPSTPSRRATGPGSRRQAGPAPARSTAP